MDDLLELFIPKFIALAKSRITRGLEIVTRCDYEAVADVMRDLHGIAGEAGLLGLASIIPFARDGEEKAKQLRVTRSEADAQALHTSLTALNRAIERLAPVTQSMKGST